MVDLPQEDYITFLSDTNRKITRQGLQNSSAKILPINSILVSSRATIGRIACIELATNQGFKNIIIKDFINISVKFVALMLKKTVKKMEELSSGGTFKEISSNSIKQIQIPLPPIEIQNKIVAEIEEEQKAVAECKKLIEKHEAKITAKINEVWGE